jgi:hypothetical protein
MSQGLCRQPPPSPHLGPLGAIAPKELPPSQCGSVPQLGVLSGGIVLCCGDGLEETTQGGGEQQFPLGLRVEG